MSPYIYAQAGFESSEDQLMMDEIVNSAFFFVGRFSSESELECPED